MFRSKRQGNFRGIKMISRTFYRQQLQVLNNECNGVGYLFDMTKLKPFFQLFTSRKLRI